MFVVARIDQEQMKKHLRLMIPTMAVVTLGEFNHGLAHLTIANEVVSVTGILRLTIVN